MESKLLWAVIREWLGLVSGSDPVADVLVEGQIHQYTFNDHRLFTPEISESIVQFNANLFPIHDELDATWRKTTLQNLCMLASTEVDQIDFKKLVRNCRAYINYVNPGGINAELQQKVLDANLSQLLRFGQELSTTIEKLEETSPEFERFRPILRDATLFKVHQGCRRLLRWMERAVLVDLIEQPTHHLSEQGQKRLEWFRTNPRTRGIPDSIARAIILAVDRRSAWAVLEELKVTEDEISITMDAVANTVTRIRRGTWEGSLQQHIHFGIDDALFDDNSGGFIHSEFEELGDWAPAAQYYYDSGLTVEQAARRARELAAMEMQMDNFLRISTHTEEIGSSSLAQSADESQEAQSEVQNEPRALKSGRDLVKEIFQDFGSLEAIEFDKIDLGLTGIINANANEIEDELLRAFSGNPREKTDGDWRESLLRTDVKLVALSYKHKTKEVRMGKPTIRKVSLALHEIAKQHGCNKVNIWLDAILSKRKDKEKDNWAVIGLYPYLVLDVVSIWGQDDDYDDINGQSMWMRVEDLCADEKTKMAVKMDRSERGYSIVSLPSIYAIHELTQALTSDSLGVASATLLRNSSKLRSSSAGKPISSVKGRMMMTAQELVKGALIGTQMSWASDKKELLLWAEACMMKNDAVLFGPGLVSNKVLYADNLTKDNVLRYLASARDRGFVDHGSTRQRGVREGWRGALELVPGLAEASPRDFVPLLPGIPDECKVRERVRVDETEIADIVTIEIEGMLVSIQFAVGKKVVQDVWVDARNDLGIGKREGSTFTCNSRWAKEAEAKFETLSSITEEDEKAWARGDAQAAS